MIAKLTSISVAFPCETWVVDKAQTPNTFDMPIQTDAHKTGVRLAAGQEVKVHVKNDKV